MTRVKTPLVRAYVTFSSFFLIAYVIVVSIFFFFNDTATTEIYTLSLHDALPISPISK